MLLNNNWTNHSLYYRRPIAYHTISVRQSRPEIIKVEDAQSTEVLNLLKNGKFEYTNLGGLGRGIRFGDIELGRRHYNYNGHKYVEEFFIHQWKSTNDLSKEHPTGSHQVYTNYAEFIHNLKRILEEKNRKKL